MEHGRRRSTRHSNRRLLTILALCIILTTLEITPAAAQGAPRLTSAVFRGVTVYEPAELFPLYRDHLGQPIERERVSAIVTALADRYQADGYRGREGRSTTGSFVSASCASMWSRRRSR